MATDVSRNGGGIGANARWTFDNKHIVFGLHGMGGSGIGRVAVSSRPAVAVSVPSGFTVQPRFISKSSYIGPQSEASWAALIAA